VKILKLSLLVGTATIIVTETNSLDVTQTECMHFNSYFSWVAMLSAFNVVVPITFCNLFLFCVCVQCVCVFMHAFACTFS